MEIECSNQFQNPVLCAPPRRDICSPGELLPVPPGEPGPPTCVARLPLQAHSSVAVVTPESLKLTSPPYLDMFHRVFIPGYSPPLKNSTGMDWSEG